MATIEEILAAAKEAGASDVHLTVGIPPKMRVNGNLVTMDFPKNVAGGYTGCNLEYYDRGSTR